jgi:hypothetical protein
VEIARDLRDADESAELCGIIDVHRPLDDVRLAAEVFDDLRFARVQAAALVQVVALAYRSAASGTVHTAWLHALLDEHGRRELRVASVLGRLNLCGAELTVAIEV